MKSRRKEMKEALMAECQKAVINLCKDIFGDRVSAASLISCLLGNHLSGQL